MLPQHERELPLTEDEVAASHRSILEQRETADPESPLDLRWYFKALQKDSPDFYDWVAQQTQSFTDSDVQVSFLVGVTRVSLPFYMRAEAKKLRERFSGV
jgi:hypothetical protein